MLFLPPFMFDLCFSSFLGIKVSFLVIGNRRSCEFAIIFLPPSRKTVCKKVTHFGRNGDRTFLPTLQAIALTIRSYHITSRAFQLHISRISIVTFMLYLYIPFWRLNLKLNCRKSHILFSFRSSLYSFTIHQELLSVR